MKLTKKLSAFLLCLPLAMLIGCASTEKKSDSKTAKAAEEAPAVEEEEEEEYEEYVGPKPEYSKHVAIPDTSSKVVTKPQEMKCKNLTATELTKIMGNGINLGNTMEAYRGWMKSTTRDATSYEQFWGQPITTQEMMNSYKAAGFDSIRIPVAWTNEMDFEHGDYTIGTNYLDRVETIVNYALNADLIVVLNDHWDGSWTGMFGSKDPQTRKDAMELYTSMWTQIANRFKNYSDYLIFEGANEELGPGLNRVDVCYDSGTLSEDEYYETSNIINQTFVDLVRSTGGNNANRFLLIPGINTDIEKTTDERFAMPTDTAKSKLILSVHYYTPWGFCGDKGSVNHWGTTKDCATMNTLMEATADFVDMGYGVIIGEYGVLNTTKDGELKPDHINWLDNFHANCDLYNFCPMLWDCNSFFKKETGKFTKPELAKFYLEHSYKAQSKYSDSELQEIAQNNIDDRMDNSPELLSDNPLVGATDKSVAWIMYNSQDWGVTYSVGDAYNPDSKSDGIKATDVEVTGEGDYTVGLDFTGLNSDGTGTSRSFAFSAIGISNGEQLFPGYCIDIKSFKVNGKEYKITALPYTSSDDGHCTRANILNEWVNKLPAEARTTTGDKKGVSATIVDKAAAQLQMIKTLEITFHYGPAK
ncbi:MAG: glycoside hydrolase family 5 protein [Treponema sp.]